MQLKILMALSLALVMAGVVQAATPNWIQEFIVVRAPQTKIVRHPTDKGKYYLCWQEGASRYGLAFRRGNFDDKLRQIQPGGSASLGAILPISQGAWSPADQKICWG
jgi:hypothetical protein